MSAPATRATVGCGLMAVRAWALSADWWSLARWTGRKCRGIVRLGYRRTHRGAGAFRAVRAPLAPTGTDFTGGVRRQLRGRRYCRLGPETMRYVHRRPEQ